MGRPRVDPQPAIDVGSTRGISKIDRVSMRCRPGVDPRSIRIDPLIGPGSIRGSRWNGNRARIEPEFDSGSLRDRSTRSRCGIDPDSMRDPPWFDSESARGRSGIARGTIRFDPVAMRVYPGSTRGRSGWIRDGSAVCGRSDIDPLSIRVGPDRPGIDQGSVRDRSGIGLGSARGRGPSRKGPEIDPVSARCQPNVSPGANPTSAPVSTRNRSGSDSEST
jgi:hypothetical protein